MNLGHPISVTTTDPNGDYVFTGRSGRFEFVGLAAGTYTFSTAVPGGLQGGYAPVTVTKLRGAAVGLSASANTRSLVYLPMVRR